MAQAIVVVWLPPLCKGRLGGVEFALTFYSSKEG